MEYLKISLNATLVPPDHDWDVEINIDCMSYECCISKHMLFKIREDIIKLSESIHDMVKNGEEIDKAAFNIFYEYKEIPARHGIDSDQN